MSKEYFRVNVSQYVSGYNFEVTCPASLDTPQEHAVMFIMKQYIDRWRQVLLVKNCLIFWPETEAVPSEVTKRHAVIKCLEPRLEYCRFFRENRIRNLPLKEPVQMIDGAYISANAKIGKDTMIMPGAYISGEVELGEQVYIGAGVKLMGRVTVGNHVVIRENSVLGADGLSTDRDPNGSGITMPQFGGVVVGNYVDIGANCVIARGAIDDTIIEDGCKVDNSVFISHNVHLGKDTFVVGETIMFGGSSTGERAYISGNATIRNKVKLGSDVLVGMGSVVTKNVGDGLTVLGSPAHVR